MLVTAIGPQLTPKEQLAQACGVFRQQQQVTHYLAEINNAWAGYPLNKVKNENFLLDPVGH